MHRGEHPSQWVAGLIVIAADIQDVELKELARAAGVSRRRLRGVLAGDIGLTLDEAHALCRALGFSFSTVAEMTMTGTHQKLMAVEMAVTPPPVLVATRPDAA